jgi:peptidyl-prolyl cis-trans isomerase C
MHQYSENKAAKMSLRKKSANLITEPLFHFIIIGVVVYFLYGVLSQQTEIESKNTITITQAEIGWMNDTWQKRWFRPPTDEERQGLIDAFVKETVMYRQALAMGLDRDDSIVRRRLAQKLEFLTRDLTELASPSQEEIRTYFQTHQEQYETPVVLSFTHLYFSPDERGEQIVQDIQETLTQLKGKDTSAENIKQIGDPFMLQQYYPQRDQQEISRLFGNEFAQQTFQLPVAQWTGPVQSGYGLHLVYVHDRIESTMPEFEDIQERVLEDWAADKRTEVDKKFYASLLSRYKVVIEEKAPSEKTPAAEKLL